MRARHAHIPLWGQLLGLGGLLCAGMAACGQGEDLAGAARDGNSEIYVMG